MTAKGKFALARALLAQGDDAGAAQLVAPGLARGHLLARRRAHAVMETFGEVLTRADHKARMDRRFYDDDPDAGMRMAQLLGGNDLLIGKARKAVVGQGLQRRARCSRRCRPRARNDAGYIFHKAQWLRRDDKPIEAARLLQSAPRSASQQHNLDEWWIERRLVARKLLDDGEHQAAYHGGARCAAADQGQSARRARVHRRLDRAALHRTIRAPPTSISRASATAPPTRSRSRAANTGRAARWKPPGRNSEARAHYQAAAQLSDRLLRADRARPARARRTCAAPSAGAWPIARR